MRAKCTNPLRSHHSWSPCTAALQAARLSPSAKENLENCCQQHSTNLFPWENLFSSPSLEWAAEVTNEVPSGWSTLCAVFFCQKCSDLLFGPDFLSCLTSCAGVCPGEA